MRLSIERTTAAAGSHRDFDNVGLASQYIYLISQLTRKLQEGGNGLVVAWASGSSASQGYIRKVIELTSWYPKCPRWTRIR